MLNPEHCFYTANTIYITPHILLSLIPVISFIYDIESVKEDSRTFCKTWRWNQVPDVEQSHKVDL